MRKVEKEFLLEVCKFRNADCEKLKYLLGHGCDTPEVLGYLFLNRMASIAYGVLWNSGLLKNTNREFKNALKMAYGHNKSKNKSYLECVEMLTDILRKHQGKYAMLKGAFLCHWYPEGYRTSNDIDLLVEGKHISIIGEELLAAGFVQGYLMDDVFTPATRQEIIASKMTRGETVPYIAQVDLPNMKYLEVDLNFSLDYKNNDTEIVSNMIKNAQEIRTGFYQMITLNQYDFLLHLCAHLYKEATTYPWVKMKRDMALYKFCDLYALLFDYTSEDFRLLENRIHKLEMESVCYYALYLTKSLFSIEHENLTALLERIAPKDKTSLNFVISPSDKKMYHYNDDDIWKRFFTHDRTSALSEVKVNA